MKKATSIPALLASSGLASATDCTYDNATVPKDAHVTTWTFCMAPLS